MTDVEDHTNEELAKVAVAFAIHAASITQNGWAGRIVLDDVAIICTDVKGFLEVIEHVAGRDPGRDNTIERSWDAEHGFAGDGDWIRLEWDHTTKSGTLTYPAVIVNLDLS